MPPSSTAATPTHRVEVPVEPESAEIAAASLWAAGALGVWERPGRLVAWFEAPVDLVDRPGLSPAGATWTTEPPRDWQAAWKASIGPVRAGGTAIVPSWLADAHVPAPGELTLVLDPGQAFGSGHHATTALCLEALERLDLTGASVVDVGCGTGVLAIAAARRGAADVLAVDLDPDAITVTRDNAARNEAAVTARVGSTDAVPAPADIVVANLVTDVLVDLARPLVAATRRTLVVSGIAAERADRVVTALEAAGARIDRRDERDGWVALVAGRSVAHDAWPAADADDPDDADEPHDADDPGRVAWTDDAGVVRPAGSPAGEGGPVSRRQVVTGRRPRPTAGSAAVLVGLLIGLMAGLLAGCAEPALLADEEEGPAAAPEVAVPDPDREALEEQLAELVASVTAARDHLLAAAGADDPTVAREHGDAAVAQLLADGTRPDGPTPLLPAETPDRGVAPARPDVLTTTLTAAREAGGDLGERVMAVLRDPVAGDLGTWARDAAGVVARIRAVADPTVPLEALDAEVLTLNGDASRALAWALLTAEASDADLARAYAERGVVHLDLILEAVEREVRPVATSDADGDADGDDRGTTDTDEADDAGEAGDADEASDAAGAVAEDDRGETDA